ERYHNTATRSKSGSRSSGSSTAVEKAGSSSSSPTSVDFVSTLPPPPQAITRLPHNGHETDSRTLHGDEYNNHKWVDQKPSTEWLNEHPASIQNRELQRKATNNGRLYRQSSTVSSHDGDCPTSKQRPQIAIHSHSQPLQYTPEGHTRSPSSLSTLTQSTNTSLSPPPRVQSPILRATSPPTSRPTSPLPSTFAGQSQQTSIRNMSSSNSLTAIRIINSFEVQPVVGNHRSSLHETFMGQSSVAKKVWGASDFGVEGSLSGNNSIGSQLSSSDTTGHYRSTSDVSTGSGALSAVGVPSF
ncbi:5313_t:CDS:2, partial [Paraglomus brasilianum]